MKETDIISDEIEALVNEWETILARLPEATISGKRNSQNRTIKQIVGHLVDSATNNTHRIVHLHYQPLPLVFPNYASFGNNDRWIAVQNYQNEDWNLLIQGWKYSLLHVSHVIRNINPEKLENEWLCRPDLKLTMKEMITDFPRHFKLHLAEIKELINTD
jgi:hypothetical protein